MHQRGFTLIELMITMAVMGLLASIALPSYNNYLRTARRADGQASLIRIQGEETRYRTNNPTYTAALASLNISSNVSDSGYYNVGITLSTDKLTYTASVTAIGDQAKDTTCATMSITYSSTSAPPSYSYSPSTCWAQ